eukprot:Skav214466  [mRNA]  locus=scaffold1167:93290:101975:+ [translate_table: standard]
MFRVGEACNPGPETWNLAAINPSGIAHKAYMLPEVGVDIVAISETHLTAVGQQKFRQELKASNRRWQFSGGSPVAPKSTSRFCTGGKHSGVGFVTAHPHRKVGGQWEDAQWSTGRIHAAHIMVDGHWVTGGVCYGYSYQSWKASVREATHALLQELSTKVMPFAGPKFLAGDWNMEPDKCEFLQMLRSIGWQDIQDVIQARWGIAPVATCKGATRKDYLMLCPMLQERVVAAQVMLDIFADHACLRVQLQKIGGVPYEPVWPKPLRIEFPKEYKEAWQEHYVQGKEACLSDGRFSPCLMTAGVKTDCPIDGTPCTVTDKYQAIWQKYEDDVDRWRRSQKLPGLLSHQRGRASVKAIQYKKAQPITVRASRQGEPTLSESSPTWLIKGVFLQIRRLVNLQRVLKAFGDKPSNARRQHAWSVWRAVLAASGFRPNFKVWWVHRPVVTEDAPILLDDSLPSAAVLRAIQTNMEVVLAHLESIQKQKCHAFCKQKYQNDVYAIFKDVRDVGPMPVETLLIRKKTTIVDVPDAGSVIVEDAQGFDPAVPIQGDQGPLMIEVCEEDQLWFQQPHSLVEGQVISQAAPVGSVDQMSFAPRQMKHKVLRMKAWPSALHACPGVHVADGTLTQLRTAALQSLRMTKAGCNASIYLGLCVHPMHDPECYVLMQCIRHVRKAIPESVFAAYACDIADVPDRQRVPGPLGVLFDRLERVSWKWVGDAVWLDHEQRVIQIYHMCFQELQSRLVLSFQASVGRKVSGRHGFAGLQAVDAAMTQKSLQHLDVEEVGLLRALLAGTFITADQTGQAHRVDRAHWVCKFCGEFDSLEHRHWRCSHTQRLRDMLDEDFFRWLDCQPECTRHRGWATFPPVVQEFQMSLLQIPDTTDRFYVRGHAGMHYAIFTDGAAMAPQVRTCRLASWAWCCATFGTWNFQLGGHGGVPGSWQTVVRAEIIAVIGVLQFCVAFSCGGLIFCDNDLVVKKLRGLLTDGDVGMDELSADDDLWGVVQALILQVGDRISIVHIYSHQDVGDSGEPVRWASRGNDFADWYAQQAALLLPEEVLQLHRQALCEVSHQRKHHKALLTYMAQVGKLSVDHGPSPMVADDEHEQHQVPDDPLAVQEIIRHVEGCVPYHFRQSGYEEWLSWFATVSDQESPVRWVSWLELLIHYQVVTEKLGVICHKGKSGNLRMWRPVDDETTTNWPALISSSPPEHGEVPGNSGILSNTYFDQDLEELLSLPQGAPPEDPNGSKWIRIVSEVETPTPANGLVTKGTDWVCSAGLTAQWGTLEFLAGG